MTRRRLTDPIRSAVGALVAFIMVLEGKEILMYVTAERRRQKKEMRRQAKPPLTNFASFWEGAA